MQQQHERIRKKRDYAADYALANQRASLLRNVAPESRLEYRDTASHNIFPDPLYKEQWYLVSCRISESPNLQIARISKAPNTNLITYSRFFHVDSQNGGAKDGLDMNIGPAWQKGYTGKGVVVSILDDGIQTNHPDLAQNYVGYSSVFVV